MGCKWKWDWVLGSVSKKYVEMDRSVGGVRGLKV